MEITGIVCEYNPFHLGHHKQIRHIQSVSPEGGIVCLMSGNYVQRGAPAIFHKAIRAQAAVESGADLVLELPVTASIASAERFASQSVSVLGSFCNTLSFGVECCDFSLLWDTAKALLCPEFSPALKDFLAQGLSFPAARQKVLESWGIEGEILASPNNILAVEYCKAILSLGLSLKIDPIPRLGNYHDTCPDEQEPSATALRSLIVGKYPWEPYTTEKAFHCFRDAGVHALLSGEKAILAKLRTMTDAEFEALPYGSEGLWRKLMRNSRECNRLEEILEATKSKRYTRTRLDRMVLCAFLGLSRGDLEQDIPYCRVLALNDKGRDILSYAREKGLFPNTGEKLNHPFEETEARCDALYGLFAVGDAEGPANPVPHPVYVK